MGPSLLKCLPPWNLDRRGFVSSGHLTRGFLLGGRQKARIRSKLGRIGRPIVAETIETQHRLPATTPYQALRVVMRIERPSALPVIDPKLKWAGEAICLEWETQTDRQYVVQAKMALTDLDWSELATLPGNGELGDLLPGSTCRFLVLSYSRIGAGRAATS